MMTIGLGAPAEPEPAPGPASPAVAEPDPVPDPDPTAEPAAGPAPPAPRPPGPPPPPGPAPTDPRARGTWGEGGGRPLSPPRRNPGPGQDRQAPRSPSLIPCPIRIPPPSPRQDRHCQPPSPRPHCPQSPQSPRHSPPPADPPAAADRSLAARAPSIQSSSQRRAQWLGRASSVPHALGTRAEERDQRVDVRLIRLDRDDVEVHAPEQLIATVTGLACSTSEVRARPAAGVDLDGIAYCLHPRPAVALVAGDRVRRVGGGAMRFWPFETRNEREAGVRYVAQAWWRLRGSRR